MQEAVNAARRGDWVLIWPGVYHENDARHHAGIWVTVPDLHIRGLSRTGVIIDGSNGGVSAPCPSSSALQNFTPRDGILVWKANGVTIQNLTVCDYLSGPGGKDGNEIWWDGGDGSGRIGLAGFAGSFLTATSLYHPANIHSRHLAQYGIYVGNAAGPGRITDSYASNMGGGAFYVGACRRACATVLSGDYGTNSAFGYFGTNSGGRLVIRDSVFNDNRTGIALSSLNNDDAPPPQDGRCPGSAVASCTLIEGNRVSDNDNVNAPGNGIASGIGIELDGGQFDTVTSNMITGNRSWGVIANDSVDTLGHLPQSHCQGGYPGIPARGLCLLPALGDLIFGNTLRGNGTFGNLGNADLATAGLIAGPTVPRNCFYANQATGGQLTSAPPGIEQPGIDGRPCGRPITVNDPVVLRQLNCAIRRGPCTVPHSVYPHQTMIDFAAMPALPEMPDPCAGTPRNGFCPATGSQAAPGGG